MKHNGFTLIELLIVLVLVSLAAALALPYASKTLDGLKLKTAVRRAEAAMKYASALSHGSGKTWTARASGQVLLLSSNGAEKEVSFPDGVRIESKDIVRFFPEGGSSGGVFKVSDDNGSFIINIEPYTGLVKVDEKRS